ncbi:MAG: DinB family protein [Clostridia bacterium]|nr:DinB family protein [Clostridia bacterium]
MTWPAILRLAMDRLPDAGIGGNVSWEEARAARLVTTEDFWIHRLAFREPAGTRADPADVAATLREYRRVRALTDGRLDAWTEEDMRRLVEVPEFSDGWRPPFPPTVFWVFHHVFEHEMYHVGQISLLLRLAGLEPLPF